MPRRTTRQMGPHPIDVHVGNKVRTRRTLLGISQMKLGEVLGITFQQVQKYEKGANRISASRLYELSRFLDVPISYFFDEVSDGKGLSPGALNQDEAMHKREVLELVRAYCRIADPDTRAALSNCVKALAD